eukprot:scaffold64546_cov30-Attheya_sp.AAC.1
MAGVLLGSGKRAEGYVRRGIFYLEKSGCVPARVDVVQRWRQFIEHPPSLHQRNKIKSNKVSEHSYIMPEHSTTPCSWHSIR